MRLLLPTCVYSLAGYIERALRAVQDEDRTIDSGGGMGGRDLWVTIEGREYCITVRHMPFGHLGRVDTPEPPP